MPRPRLAEKALTIAVGTGVQNLVQIAGTLFLVRLLDSQELFGTYRQVWLVINTLTPLLLLGLPYAVYFFLPSLAAERHRAFMARAVLLVSGLGLLFSVGMYVGAPWVSGLFDNPTLITPFRAAALFPLFGIPSMLLFPFLVSKERHTRGLVINLAFSLTQWVLVVILAALGASLAKIFYWVVLVVAVRYVVSLTEMARHSTGPVLGPSVKLREILGYSIPVGLSNILTLLGQQLDKLVVSAFLGTVNYAVYSVGAMEFPGILLVSTSSNTVMRPHIAGLHHEGNRGEIYRFWRESLRKQALVIIPMAVFLAAFARELMVLLFTADYAGATPIFQIYLAVALFRIAPPSVILTSVGETRVVLYGTAAYLAGNLAMNIALVGPMGMLGPPTATFIATAGLMAYYALRASRYLGVAFSDMIPVWILLRTALVAVVATVFSLVAKLPDWQGLVALIVGALIVLPAYVVIGKAARVLTSDDIAILRRWLTFRWIREG